MGAIIIHKSLLSLSAAEKATFVRALLELKRRGRYDEYVHRHHHVMVPSVLPSEPRDANYRNGAHRVQRSCRGIGSFYAGRSGFAFDRAIRLRAVLGLDTDAKLPDPMKARRISHSSVGKVGIICANRRERTRLRMARLAPTFIDAWMRLVAVA